MKLPKTTLILILLALGLGSFVYFHEIKGKTQKIEIKAQKQKIFAFTADDVQSLTIKFKETTLQLEKRNTSEKPQWEIKSPISALANDAIVSYLMDLLVDGKSERTLPISPAELSEFGLDKPVATIDVKLKNQQSHQLILGKGDFNNQFLYAQADANKNMNLLLVSKDFVNAVNRDISEWKQIVKKTNEQPLPTLTTPTPINSK
jgi:ribosomal protein L23